MKKSLKNPDYYYQDWSLLFGGSGFLGFRARKETHNQQNFIVDLIW